MKRFLCNSCAFLALQALIFGMLVVAARKHPEPFLAVIRDKREMLHNCESPRLLLVGGSNLAFGMHSEILAESLPYRPVNLGTHAALGLEFILAEARAGVRPGDVVVLSLEYGLLQSHGGNETLWEGILSAPETAMRMHWEDLTDEGFGFLAHVTNRGRKGLSGNLEHPATGIYRRESFNQYGDVVAHRQLPPVRPFVYSIERQVIPDDPEVTEQMLPLLQDFVTECEARGRNGSHLLSTDSR